MPLINDELEFQISQFPNPGAFSHNIFFSLPFKFSVPQNWIYIKIS